MRKLHQILLITYILFIILINLFPPCSEKSVGSGFTLLKFKPIWKIIKTPYLVIKNEDNHNNDTVWVYSIKTNVILIEILSITLICSALFVLINKRSV